MSRRPHPYKRGGGPRGGGGSLNPGVRGFMCTCNNRERECVREALNLLTEYADLIYGREHENDESGENSEEDVADAVQREAKQLMQTKRHQSRFRVLSSGARNCVFIASTVTDPVSLAHRLLRDVQDTRRSRARYLLRLIPVEVTCRANLEEISRAAGPLFDQHFSAGDKTFSVIFKCRNNSSISRTAVVDALAQLVKLKNASNRADLTAPQLAVVVEILRSVCCLAVVPDYFGLAKYNILAASGTAVEGTTQPSAGTACKDSTPEQKTDERAIPCPASLQEPESNSAVDAGQSSSMQQTESISALDSDEHLPAECQDPTVSQDDAGKSTEEVTKK